MPGKKYPFLISTTDRSSEGGIYWWSILNISPKSKLLFFDSSGISGMKSFIVTDDKKIVRKALKWFELADRNDNKLTLIRLKFSMNGYENMTENEMFNIFSAAQDFFHLIYSFG